MDRVGRYQLLDKLGEGGMGVVYKAYDPLIQRVVAVKLISSARTDDPVLRERFFAEARAAGHLSHRNIVTVYDLGEENERPYFAMEFLEGEDLGRMIRRGAPPTLIDKIDLMAQAGRGLAYAHARGVIHRDVKPANIFVTTTGDVKVLDFGLARLARPVGTDLTRTRPFVGTVSYMAPEQVRGEPADARTDLFAFGVVLYEMLSGGRPAFETDSFASTMHRILTEEPEPLAGLDATLPEELTRVVERALAKSRDERYQRVDEMLADLAAFRASLNAGAEPHARFTPTPGPRRASLEGLDVTVGHEAAVDVRTPPPRALPASPVPASPSPTPVSSVPAAASRPPARWHAGPGAWVAAAVVVAGIATTVAWLTWFQPQGSAPAGGTTVHGVPTSGTAGQATGAGPAVEGPRDKVSEAAAVPGGAPPSPAAAAPAAPPPPSAPATAERRRDEGEEARRPQRRGEPGANVPAPPAAKSPGPDPAADEAARLLTQNARVEAARARGRAESAGAERLAGETYAAAVDAERAAAEQFRSGAPERARLAFIEVVALFERAESEARAEQARQRELERRAAEPPVTSSPPATAVPTIPSSAGAAGAGGAAPPEPPPGAADAVAAREAIRSLLSRYTAALESRSLARLKQVWPGLSGAQERAIADEFQHARSIAVTLADEQIDVRGPTATVSCRRAYRLETRDGQRLESVTRAEFGLRQAAGGWVIEHVRHEQR